MGGIKGCTHLRELLGQMGTVAFQTMYGLARRTAGAPNSLEAPSRPALLNSCLAYADGSDIARRTWPDYYASKA